MNNQEILKRLEEIEARTEKATPGPWRPDLLLYEDLTVGITSSLTGQLVANCYAIGEIDPNINGEFIAHSREDVPWLCKTVRQLVARLEEIKAKNAAMREALEKISRTEPDEKPDGTTLGYLVHDAYEMCEIADAALKNDAGRELLDCLRKLKSAAQLALQALTKGMADVPMERDKRCAALRVKAKRALREALGSISEEGEETSWSY